MASGAHLSTFSWYFSLSSCSAPARKPYTYSLNVLCSTCALCRENSVCRSFFRLQRSPPQRPSPTSPSSITVTASDFIVFAGFKMPRNPLLFSFFFFLEAVLGLCCYKWAFSSCSKWGLLSSCVAQASHCSGFSLHRAWGLAHAGFSNCSKWA